MSDKETEPLSETDRLALLEAQISRMQETLDKQVEFLSAIKDELQPIIEDIAASPVGKILGMKRKGKTDE